MNNKRQITIKTSKNAIYIFENYRTFISINIKANERMDVVIVVDSESMIMASYEFLKELWEAGFDAETEIIFGGSSYKLSDENLEREFYHFTLTDEMLAEFPAPGLLARVINYYKIKKFKNLYDVTNIKFSGLLAYNELDKLYNTEKYNVYVDKNTIMIKNINNFIIYNRYIDYDIDISRSKNIVFVNCVFARDVGIRDSSHIEFIGCIVRNNITFVGEVSEPIFQESIIGTFSLYNTMVDKFKLEETNIKSLAIMCSTIENCDWNTIKIELLNIEASNIPKYQINISQINTKNLTSYSYIKKYLIDDEEKFFVRFWKHKKNERKNTNHTACLSTISYLLENATLGTDKNIISELKYKKNLYAVKGIKRAYIFFTGSFLKPSRFLIYGIGVNLITIFLLMLPINGFRNGEGIVVALNLLESIKYCAELLLNINLLEYEALNIVLFIAVLYKSLTSVFVAGFFTSLTKKMIEQ